MSRYSVRVLATLATLVCGHAHAALIEAALTPKPAGDWLLVVIDDWNPSNDIPMRWRARVGEADAPIDLATFKLYPFDRSAFWLERSTPFVYIEGLALPHLGVALHDFTPEAASGEADVTVYPDSDPGHFMYLLDFSGRQVFLTLTPTPEPSSAVLLLFGLAAVWRRHSTSYGS